MNLKCPYFSLCGGCSKLDKSYEEEIKEKEEYIKKIFQSVGYKKLVEILKADNNSQDEIDEAIEILTNCGAIEYARNLAHESVIEAKKVLEILDDSSSKQVLADIADFVLERSA